MSLHHLAKQIAAKGRDEDKMLVHMTPREVAGLQQIAMAHGGSLTINPETGLPEAGFLKSILPMLAGAVATFFTGGAAAPWMAALAGGVTGAATGDKNQSLLMRMGMGALGGWGGGSLAAGLAKAGSSTVANQVAKTATDQGVKAATNAAATNVAKTGASALFPNGITGTVVNPIANAGAQAGTQLAKSSLGTVAKTAVGEGAKTAASGILSNAPTGLARLQAIGSGLTRVGSEAGRNAIASGMYGGMGKAGLLAAAAPVVAAGATPPTLKNAKEVVPEYQMYSYNPGTVNPNFGQPGEPYFIGQGYSAPKITNQNPFAPTYASYDKKGKPVGPAGLSPLEQYMQGIQQQQEPPIAAAEGGSLTDYMNRMNEAKVTSDPPPAALGDYMANLNQNRTASSSPMEYRPPNMTPNGGMGYNYYNMEPGIRGVGGTGGGANMMASTMRPAMFAEGGITSIGGYSDGGRLLRGPGDGVSDDIPATIHRDDGTKQEARLADGEFVFPARIVSEIGNGSTEAGAQKLYAVMDRIQKGRAKTLKDVAADTNAIRHVEALA